MASPVKNNPNSSKILHLGDPGIRIVAAIIDAVLVSLPTVVLILPISLFALFITPFHTSRLNAVELFWLGSSFPKDNFLLSLIVGLLTLALQVIYHVVIPSKILNGQTFGMKFLNLKVVKENSTSVTFNTMFERYSLQILIDLLILLPTLGSVFSTINFLILVANLILLFSDTKHQTIFDKIAHTVVVEA